MKDSTRHTLDVLRTGPKTTHELLEADCGTRYGARLFELRELGFVIDTSPRKGGALYTLVHDPEKAAGESGAQSTPASAGRSLGATDAPELRAGREVDQCAPAVDVPGDRSATPSSDPLFDAPPARRPYEDVDEEAA